MRYSKVFKRKNLIHIISIVLIVLVTLININNFNMPVVLNDEFGYWSNAEMFVHQNWADLVKETPYYSMGYSFVLIPVLFFCKTYKAAYHTGLVLNTVFLIVSYFCAYYILKVRNPKKNNDVLLSLESLAVCLLASNIFYSHITWCEIFLIMIMWLIAAIFVSMEHKYRNYKLILASILVVFSYLIHQRALGLIIAFAIVMSIFLVSRKKYYQIALIILSVVLAIVFQSLVKDLQNDLIDNMRNTMLNDYTVSTNLISNKMSVIITRFTEFLVSFVGKIYILFVCSLGVFAIGLKNYILKISSAIKRKKTEYLFSESFFALVIVCMVGLNTIQCINSLERKDVIVYTRYMEYSFGPFLLISLDELVNNLKKEYKMLLASLSLLVPLTFVVFKQLLDAGGSFNNSCSPFAAGFVECFSDDFSECCIAIILILIVFLLTCSIAATTKFSEKNKYAVCIVFVVINIFVSTFVVDWLAETQEIFYQRVAPIEKIIKSDKTNKPIYFITDNEKYPYSTNVKFLQFVLFDRPIIVVQSYGQINYEGEYFLLTNARLYPVLQSQGIEYEVTTPFTNLYLVEGHIRSEKK